MDERELHRLIALVVFVGAYAGLGIGRLPPFRIDRTGVAIIGAAVTVVTGVVAWDRAVAAVDAHTLVLLFGMMYREIDWELLVLFSGLFVVIAGVEASGLADELLGVAGAANLHHPAVLTIVTAALSNLVSNVPAVLLFKSIIPTFGEPARGWLLLAMASTFAGNLTILGSIANLIVVEEARTGGIEIGFIEYSKVGIPITLITLLIGWAILSLVPA